MVRVLLETNSGGITSNPTNSPFGDFGSSTTTTSNARSFTTTTNGISEYAKEAEGSLEVGKGLSEFRPIRTDGEEFAEAGAV